MTRTRIKICGITRPEDALHAVECGADAIGLVFYAKSPRAVTIDQAVAIACELPPFVSVVALFVDAAPDFITTVLGQVSVNTLQFHGDESAQFCAQFERPYIKALRVRPSDDPVAASLAYPSARGILLDSWREGVPGGTGETFDWRLARGVFPKPLVLAGGLNAANVGTAIEQVRPDAVDVSGGVELKPGIKDALGIASFIRAVRTADQKLDGTLDE